MQCRQGSTYTGRAPGRARPPSRTSRAAASASSATFLMPTLPPLSIRGFRSTYTSRRPPDLARGIGRIVALEEVMPDKSSEATGQVFEPDRPHKSLHVLGRCPKTKTLVTGLKAARVSDMPSKPVCGRELAGGFDSRPPPLAKQRSNRAQPVVGRDARARLHNHLFTLGIETGSDYTQVQRTSAWPHPAHRIVQ